MLANVLNSRVIAVQRVSQLLKQSGSF